MFRLTIITVVDKLWLQKENFISFSIIKAKKKSPFKFPYQGYKTSKDAIYFLEYSLLVWFRDTWSVMSLQMHRQMDLELFLMITFQSKTIFLVQLCLVE